MAFNFSFFSSSSRKPYSSCLACNSSFFCRISSSVRFLSTSANLACSCNTLSLFLFSKSRSLFVIRSSSFFNSFSRLSISSKICFSSLSCKSFSRSSNSPSFCSIISKRFISSSSFNCNSFARNFCSRLFNSSSFCLITSTISAFSSPRTSFTAFLTICSMKVLANSSNISLSTWYSRGEVGPRASSEEPSCSFPYTVMWLYRLLHSGASFSDSASVAVSSQPSDSLQYLLTVSSGWLSFGLKAVTRISSFGRL